MNNFLAALTFLTTIPVSGKKFQKDDFTNAQRFFPLVGAIIGIIAAIVCYVLFQIFPQQVAAALSTITLLILTGGLHIDGLSDTADGFLSHRNREKTRAIMKDSCIGSFGSLAQICLLLLKFTALLSLADFACLALLIAPLTGRTAILLISHIVPPADTTGLGYTVNSGKSKFALNGGIICSFLLAALIFGVNGILAILLALAAAWILGKISKRKIGGYTGDILGAGCEISEAVTLIILSTAII